MRKRCTSDHRCEQSVQSLHEPSRARAVGIYHRSKRSVQALRELEQLYPAQQELARSQKALLCARASLAALRKSHAAVAAVSPGSDSKAAAALGDRTPASFPDDAVLAFLERERALIGAQVAFRDAVRVDAQHKVRLSPAFFTDSKPVPPLATPFQRHGILSGLILPKSLVAAGRQSSQ